MRKRCFLEANDRYLLTGILEDKLTVNACKKTYDLKLRNLRRTYSMNHIMTTHTIRHGIMDQNQNIELDAAASTISSPNHFFPATVLYTTSYDTAGNTDFDFLVSVQQSLV
ncbi:hypothetical protein J6590_087033 [Homalodisca vitripennis]|nr:hypothetical protein J6590_087033 [Homalodisca vitripennis]